MDTSAPLCASMGSLSSWLETKRMLEGERDRKLEALDRQITIAQAEYGAIYNKNAPVLTLPAEVTCLIFLEVFSTFECDDGNTQVHLTEVTISHVCRKWRSVAIGLPILWSSFYYHDASATPATLNCFKVYLERSKSNTLELWFDFRNTTIDLEMYSNVLDQAIEVASRWRLVSIFSDEASTEIAARLKTLHAPNLEHLALYHNPIISFRDVVQGLEPRIFAKGAPKLLSVRLGMTTPVFYLPPLSTVTTLFFDYRPRPNGCEWPLSLATLCIILTLPNLESLSLVEVYIGGSVYEPNDIAKNLPVFMGRLRNLRISDCHNMLKLLPSIRAPLLETLVLQNMLINEVVWHPPTNVPKSDPYSFPSLMSLSLIDISCNTAFPNTISNARDSLRFFAQTTNAARRITIVHNESEPKVKLGVLSAIQPSWKPLWPHLETLICDFDFWGYVETLWRTVMCQKSVGDLTLRLSKTQVKEDVDAEGVFAQFSNLCTVEEVPDEELQDPGPWPPGGDGVLGRRIDLEADPFVTKISHE